MTSPMRPQPRFPEPDTEAFWDATKRHELTFQRCNSCGETIFYPRRHCTNCGSTDTSSQVSKGEGVVYTFTEHAHRVHPIRETACERLSFFSLVR